MRDMESSRKDALAAAAAAGTDLGETAKCETRFLARSLRSGPSEERRREDDTRRGPADRVFTTSNAASGNGESKEAVVGSPATGTAGFLAPATIEGLGEGFSSSKTATRVGFFRLRKPCAMRPLVREELAVGGVFSLSSFESAEGRPGLFCNAALSFREALSGGMDPKAVTARRGLTDETCASCSISVALLSASQPSAVSSPVGQLVDQSIVTAHLLGKERFS
jgi:hypothetical protein